MKPQHIFEEIKLGPLMLHLHKGYDELNGRMIFWIDLFAGAGGTTTGIHLAGLDNVKVVACVNHDYNALMSHWRNHPECMHFVEDVRDFKVVVALSNLVTELRSQFPGCVINLWASLECTNYSKAKGGLPRDADSRTLAHALFMYIEELKPDYVYIENVREFMSWGPLDEKGRPISKLNGRDYLRWIKELCSYGYQYDYQLINSADHGAYTSRERYFGQFAKIGLPMKWPETTHSKSPDFGGLFGAKAKWKAVREVLNLWDEGQSIFTRVKPLCEKTLQRILDGLIKFVAGGEDIFLTAHYSTGKNVHSVLMPCPTVSTKDRFTKVEAQFIQSYFSGGGQLGSIEQPNPTITGVPKQRLTTINFMDQQYGMSKPASIEDPAGTITSNPKLNLISADRFLLNPQYANKGGSLDKPCFTLIARMDKMPPYIVSASSGKIFAVPIFERECETMQKIRMFMAVYGIIDIKMRMLVIDELLRIQGFPDGYHLEGTQTEQKKFIGNAVVPVVAKALVQSNSKAIEMYLNKIAV